MAWHVLAFVVVWSSLVVAAAAQTLPSDPVSVGDGRVVLGADASLSVAPEDEGFFNYSDYERSTLRELRLSLTARARLADRLSVLADIRTENFARLAVFGLYARVQPLPGRRLDVQIGRIPPVFGSFSRQSYRRGTSLVGSPLAYQYLTSVRADAVPATPAELLQMRGRGWLSAFTVGNTAPARGVPLVTAAHWDRGVQVSTGWGRVDVAAAITDGAPARPHVSGDGGPRQVAARVTVTPAFGLVVGASAARGRFLAQNVRALLGEERRDRAHQRAYGIDAEYTRGHGLVRTELVLSEWDMPFPAAPSESLRAFGASVEGRYAVWPGAYLAARGDHLTFSRVQGSTGPLHWDAPVTRVEAGGGYHLQRNLVAKAVVQVNWRDGGRIAHARLLAGQVQYWF